MAFSAFVKPFRPAFDAGLAAAVWTPSMLSSLTAWWDFSDAATLFEDDAATNPCEADDLIAYVTDKSGNAKHASQTNNTYRPQWKANIQNGLSAALLSGDFLQMASVSAFEVFAVLKLTEFSTQSVNYNQPGILSNGSSTIGGNSSSGGNKIRTIHWKTSAYYGPEVAASVNTTYLFHDIYTPTTTLEMQLNGGTMATYNSTGLDATRPATRIGRTQSWTGIATIAGYLMEIITCGAAQTAENRTACHSYLNSKWAIY